jgi:ABC-type transport system involved in cytochrome c biogenesis permease subunit
MIAMDEIVFWGIAYACFLVATGAYVVILWRGLDVAVLVGRLTGSLGAVLMAAGLIIRLARTGRWFPIGSGEVAVAVVVIAAVVFLVVERWGELQGGGAGVFLLVVLLDSFVLWGLVILEEGSIPSVMGDSSVLATLRVALDAVAYGCLLVSGGISLVRMVPARLSIASYLPDDALDAEAWRTLVWGVLALSGGLVIGALAAYLAGRSLWSPESGLLWPMAVWVVCGGSVAVGRAGGWRAALTTLATVAAFVAVLGGGS